MGGRATGRGVGVGGVGGEGKGCLVRGHDAGTGNGGKVSLLLLIVNIIEVAQLVFKEHRLSLQAPHPT